MSSFPRSFSILLVALAVLVTANAFSVVSPLSKRTAAPTLHMAADLGEEMVTLRTMNVVVSERPLGVVLEELGDGKGVFAAECDLDGAAYAAGIRDGDVLAAIDNDETILNADLDSALGLLAAAPVPINIRVYRELEQAAALGTKGGGTVKMAPRRLPSTKKLLKASTNAKFWQDPLMIGSAVLTVAMPLGIYVASSMIGK